METNGKGLDGQQLSQYQFEQTLQPGDVVRAKWTNNFQYFMGRAVVQEKFKSSIRVVLLEDVTRADWRVPEGGTLAQAKWSGGMPYLKAGHSLSIPLTGNRKWSTNHRVTPAVGTVLNYEE